MAKKSASYKVNKKDIDNIVTYFFLKKITTPPLSGLIMCLKNLSTMVKNNLNRIESIHATLDSHSYVHIAHPIFWCNSNIISIYE
jgi:hypothetical protein